jgi:hypothetical protein
LQQNYLHKNIQKTQLWANNPIATQKKFYKINQRGKQTQFGSTIILTKLKMRRILQTKFQFGIMGLKPYVDKVVQGQENILWKENRSILLKLEQLRSKYIPLTKESMPYHIEAARNAILHYILKQVKLIL